MLKTSCQGRIELPSQDSLPPLPTSQDSASIPRLYEWHGSRIAMWDCQPKIAGLFHWHPVPGGGGGDGIRTKETTRHPLPLRTTIIVWYSKTKLESQLSPVPLTVTAYLRLNGARYQNNGWRGLAVLICPVSSEWTFMNNYIFLRKAKIEWNRL